MNELRLTREQYRMFAERTKAVGMALNVCKPGGMGGCWGLNSPWALPVCADATASQPAWKEKALITIATSINAGAFRAAAPNRPELDWSVLEDCEIYPFMIQHEIGHRQDNFSVTDLMVSKAEEETRDQCHRRLRYANEILADRYAWRQVRPGEPLPMNERGRREWEKIAECLAFVEKHLPRKRPCKPEHRLLPGVYNDVSDYMLATPERAAFLGRHVDQRLLTARVAYHRQFRDERGYYLWESAPMLGSRH